MGTVLLPNSVPTDNSTSILDQYHHYTLNIAPGTSNSILLQLIVIFTILFGVRYARYMKRCRSVSKRVLVEEILYKSLNYESNTITITPYKTDDIIIPPNIKTRINYPQHYHQTHNNPITIKSINTTLSTYDPFTTFTSTKTPYNHLLHTPNTIPHSPSTPTNHFIHIDQIKNQHIRFDPIIDNLTTVLLALFIILADYLCSSHITNTTKISISSYGNITLTHPYHQKYEHNPTPYGPPIKTTTQDEPHTHTLPINIILPPNAHITTKSNNINISKMNISLYITIITTPHGLPTPDTPHRSPTLPTNTQTPPIKSNNPPHNTLSKSSIKKIPETLIPSSHSYIQTYKYNTTSDHTQIETPLQNNKNTKTPIQIINKKDYNRSIIKLQITTTTLTTKSSLQQLTTTIKSTKNNSNIT